MVMITFYFLFLLKPEGKKSNSILLDKQSVFLWTVLLSIYLIWESLVAMCLMCSYHCPVFDLGFVFLKIYKVIQMFSLPNFVCRQLCLWTIPLGHLSQVPLYRFFWESSMSARLLCMELLPCDFKWILRVWRIPVCIWPLQYLTTDHPV